MKIKKSELKSLVLEQVKQSDLEIVTKEEAAKLAMNTRGKLFDVVFRKKNGDIRRMNARTGVKKHLKGGELSYDPLEKGLLPVYDVRKKAYRMINLNTITSIRIGKQKYLVR